MTTIAYKDGIIAADTMATMGDEKGFGFTKLFSTNRFIAGCSGSVVNVVPLYDWLLANEEMLGSRGAIDLYRRWEEIQLDDNYQVILVDKMDRSVWYAARDFPVRMDCDFFATGSGCQYAMGAMAMGASAADAVRAARRFDINTGGHVAILRLG